MMEYRSYGNLSKDINKNIHKINTQGFDLIVGIPRSGIVPSYMVSLLLNVHCIDFPGFIRNEKLCKGRTRDAAYHIVNSHDAKNILLIDDSVLSGKSMLQAMSQISKVYKGNITTAVVYAVDQNHKDVDIVLSRVGHPRVFEWNIYHHSIMSKSCVDIDGVLCYDPTKEDNDDGEKYIEFLSNAKPRFIPTVKIDFLVTNRLEKYREETETWLAKHGVKFNALIMLDLPGKDERVSQSDYYAHKANFYKKSNTSLFVESDIGQAIEIANRSNKFVFCSDENIMITPGGLKRFKNKEYFLTKVRYKLSRIHVLRALYYSLLRLRKDLL